MNFALHTVANTTTSGLTASTAGMAMRGRTTAELSSLLPCWAETLAAGKITAWLVSWASCSWKSQRLLPREGKIWKPTVSFFQSHFFWLQPHCNLSVRVSRSHIDLVSLETSLLNSSSKHQPDWKRNSIKGKNHLVAPGVCARKSYWNMNFWFPEKHVWVFLIYLFFLIHFFVIGMDKYSKILADDSVILMLAIFLLLANNLDYCYFSNFM